MDTYTLMCSKLPELQEYLQEYWKNKTGEYCKWYDNRFKEIRQTIWDINDMRNLRGFEADFIFLPDLEQLIGMLEDYTGEAWDLGVGLSGYEASISINSECHIYQGSTPKEALIQLVAYELWHKTWKEDKWV